MPRAIQDLEHASDFYQTQSSSLGRYFIESLLTDVESLRTTGGVHAEQFGFHRKIAKRFPFAIYYRLASDSVKVFAVLDCRQDPSKIGDRLKQEILQV